MTQLWRLRLQDVLRSMEIYPTDWINYKLLSYTNGDQNASQTGATANHSHLYASLASETRNENASNGIDIIGYSDLLDTNLSRWANMAETACCLPGSEKVVVPMLFSIVVVLGCLGNSLVIVVVLKNRDQFRNTTNLFILNLALADMLFLIFCIPFHAIIYTTLEWPFGQFMCKFVHLIQYSSMIASIFTLVAMALDRYLAVAYPLKTKHIRTPVVALAISVLIWLLSVSMAMPWPVFYTVRVYTQFGPDPVTVCADDWGNIRRDRPTYFLVLFVLGYAFPLLSIFVLSLLMIHQLWTTEGPEGPNLEESNKAKKKVTRLVITVVIVFCICWLPSHIIWLWTNYNQKTWQTTYAFYYLRIFAHVLSYANSSMNPIIYAFLSENFRKAFHRALRCTANRITPVMPTASKTVYSITATQEDQRGSFLADTCV